MIFLSFLLLATCPYYIATVIAARRWHQNAQRPASNALTPITILKPLRGSDPDQLASFESFCKQDYPVYQIVFGALDPDDPGLETARRLARQYPTCDITVVSGGEVFGYNRKVCNLANMLPHAKHDLLVLCDSDMRVLPDYLRRIAAPFANSTVGLVTCPYRGHLARGLASSLEALGIGADFMPSAFVGWYLTGLRFAFGSTIALPKLVLEKIGGFPALANELADDYLLAAGAQQAGYEVVLSDYVIDDVLGSEGVGEMWSRRLRWAKTSRAMRPGPYAGAFITHATTIALLMLFVVRFQPVGWIGLGTVLVVRALTATWIARWYTKDENLPRLLWLLPLSDLVSFALWACSFFGRHIVWRGERFRLLRGGKLEKA